MTDDLLLILLGLMLAFNIGHFVTLNKCERALLALSMESKKLTDYDPTESVDLIRQEIEEIVGDTLAQIQTPTALDHIGGIFAQFAQMKMMRQAQEMGMLPDELEPPID